MSYSLVIYKLEVSWPSSEFFYFWDKKYDHSSLLDLKYHQLAEKQTAMKEPGSSSNLWFKTDAGMLVAHIGLFPPLNGTQCLDEKCNSAGLLWVDDTQATIFPSNLTSMDAQEYDKCFYLDVQFRRISGSRFCFEARRARHYICQFVCPG